MSTRAGTRLSIGARSYLIEMWKDRCAYCGSPEWSSIDHIIPWSFCADPQNFLRFGRGRRHLWNFALACAPCNSAKGNQFADEFLSGDLDTLASVLAQVTLMRNDRDLPSGRRRG